jgi:CBS domain-containing protein
MSPRPRAAREPIVHAPATWIETIPVQRWMRQPVITVEPGISVRDAVAIMRERRVRHLPVVDDRERLIGIVTDRDLRQVALDAALGRVSADAGQIGEVPVREVMTWAVVAVVPQTGLHE